jgi:diadenosine tetraphosphatase ApaH/serine/threonine PP2A family protein phosphatase
MRYLVLSDIHANLEGLEAVLAAARSDTYDRVVVLGDLVGYGADPNAVVDRIRALEPEVVLRGNHDKVASGVEPPHTFNTLAREAALWTLETLTPDNLVYLAALPEGPLPLGASAVLCHGAPFDEDAYIFDDLDALRAARAIRVPLGLFGHTHVPAIFSLSAERFDVLAPDAGAGRLVMAEGTRYLANVGSVGQPRDGDPRAAFGYYDEARQELVLRRVSYDVARAQRKIVAAGLPEPLALRLAVGR